MIGISSFGFEFWEFLTESLLRQDIDSVSRVGEANNNIIDKKTAVRKKATHWQCNSDVDDKIVVLVIVHTSA